MLACPNCEYENNSKGRPVVTGDVATCLTCGNSWKEYSNGQPNRFTATPKPRVKPQPLGINVPFEHQSPSRRPDKQPTHQPAGWIISGVVLLVLAIGIFASLSFLSPKQIEKELLIADIKLEMNNRANGVQIVTVRGKIKNNSPQRKSVPPVTIVLRDHHGTEISRWRYKSLKVVLGPGSAAGFSSSIQHPSTSIASADIVLH